MIGTGARGPIGRDRTGDAFGVLRVLRRGAERGTWVVHCPECNVERVVTTKALNGQPGPSGHLGCKRESRRLRGLP